MSRGRVQGLDVLRGVAVGLVLLRHAWPDVFPGAGIVGVTIFFALSGYLITGVLVRDIARNGRVTYSAFYRNRAVRLLPALALFLLALTAVTLILDPLGERDRLGPTLAIALTYTADLPIPVAMNTGTTHLWTLAVEEQFYLVWPLLLLLAARRGRVKPMVLTAIAGLALFAAASAVVFQENPAGLYKLPSSWASALAIGAAAYMWRDRLGAFASSRAIGPAAAAAAGVLATCTFVPGAKDQSATYIVGAPLIAACTVVLIGYASRWRELPSQAWVPLRALGTISYAAYLWNFLIVAWVTGDDGRISWWQAVATLPLTLAAATASWWLLEKRANEQWKARPVTDRPRLETKRFA